VSKPSKAPTEHVSTMEILTDAAETLDRLLPIDAVAETLAVPRTSIYAMIQKQGFPLPVKIGTRSRWRQSEIMAWLDARPRMAQRSSRTPPNRP